MNSDSQGSPKFTRASKHTSNVNDLLMLVLIIKAVGVGIAVIGSIVFAAPLAVSIVEELGTAIDGFTVLLGALLILGGSFAYKYG